VYRDVTTLDADAVPAGEMVLFEAAASGRGERADWQRAAALAPGRQLVLAGGLTPDNVGEAIATVRPWGVDVSSGVESRRGLKDVGLITAFVDAVRAAELRHAI
jgi:phosphoribosylanthranilate isomerase